MTYVYYGGAPRVNFSAAMRAELSRGVTLPGSPRVSAVFDLVAPDGVTYSYSTAGAGGAQPQIAQLEAPNFNVDIRQPGIANVEMGVTLYDNAARDFAKLTAKYPRSLRGSVSRLRLLSDNVPTLDAFVGFSGVLDSAPLTQPGVWSLRLRPNDRALAKGFHNTRKASASDWAQIDPTALAQGYPVIYGEHSALGVGNNGACECLYIDTAGFRYVACLGRATIDGVYSDGVLQASSAYAITYVTTGAAVFTVVDFTTTQAGKIITVDVRGLTDKGDGTGILIRNPVRQLQHWLENFVWGAWRQGSYLPEGTAPLDMTSFAAVADYFDSIGAEGAVRFSGPDPIRCADTLDAWLQSFGGKAYWNHEGKLALALIRPDLLAYPERDPISIDADGGGAFGVPSDTSNLVRRLTVSYLFHSAAGEFKQTLNVADLSVADDVTQTLDMDWSPARVR